MKNILKFSILILLSLLATPLKTSASHMMGADITYICIKDYEYKIIVKVYRDCRGISFALGGSDARIRCVSSNASINLNMTRTAIRDITPVCANTNQRCNPPNTWATGEGIEEHVYEVTVDFNRSPWSNYKNCCEIRIEVGQCCRNGQITTGASNADFFTYATMNICKAKCNTSPNLTTEPIAYLCCDQPFFFNNGATDNEGDSISYSFTDPLRSWGQTIGYNNGLAYDIPLDVYFPPRRRHPHNNPGTDPPEGIFLDSTTGDLIFTPTNCNQITVMVIEQKEWRKDSTGKWEVIGITRRDIQMVVRQCAGNNPPVIKGKNFHTVCAGEQICFTIDSDDKQYIPPPPLPAGKNDTVKLTWNRGISGATFRILNSNARLQSAEFCWTPRKEDARTLPYQFTVTARDDACPLNAVAIRAFRVRVKQIAEASVDIDTLDCGRYSINAIPIQGFEGVPEYTWTLRDSNNVVITDPKTARFLSNNFYLSSTKTDTIKFGKGGKYIIQLNLNNLGINCPNVYLDTIVVPEQLEVNLSFGRDTFLCDGNTLTLRPTIKNGNSPVRYKWYTPINHNTNDTLNNLDITLFTPDSLFFVQVTDRTGCVDGDSIRVYLRNNPNVVLPPDKRICPYDSYLLSMRIDTAYWYNPIDSSYKIQGSTFIKEWTYNNTFKSDKDSILIDQMGQYIIKITDSVGCQDADTFFLFVNDDFYADAGVDKTICWDDTVVLISSFSKGGYDWFDISVNPKVNVGKTDTLKIKLRNDKKFELLLSQTEDTLTCYRIDTVEVFVNLLPVLKMPNNLTLCCDAGLISLQVSSRAEPLGGVWSVRQNPNIILNNQFYTNIACNPNSVSRYNLIYTYTDPSTTCTNKDSIIAVVNPLPRVELKPYIFACQDDGEVLLNNYIIRPLNQSLGRGIWSDIPNLNKQTPSIYNAGTVLLPDYRIRVSETYWKLINDNTDTVYLQYTFTNGDGCSNTDTIPVYINKVPKITFGNIEEVCEDYGLLSLNKHTSVFPTIGNWQCVDTIGFSPCNNLVWNNKDTLNVILGNSKPGKYYLRYILTGNCDISRDTFLIINPIPNVNIENSTYINGGLTIRFDRQICEIDGDVRLNATPIGGTWSSNYNNVISGTRFLTNNSPKNKLIELYYFYVNPITGCANSDTSDITVQETPFVNIVTPEYDLCRKSDLSVQYEANYGNTSGITWFVVSNEYVNITNNRSNPTNIVFNTPNDTTYRYIIISQTDEGDACPSTSDVKLIRIHPVPDINITLSDTSNCQPLYSEMSVLINNSFDTSISSYNWMINGINFSNSKNSNITINEVGINNLSLQIISGFGCDTTVSIPVYVYPKPVAEFEPIPKKSTVALPKFNFVNNSIVNPILNSSIVSNKWDFGDPFTIDDTSSKRNGYWYYNNIDTGRYEISLLVTTNWGCMDTITNLVIIEPDIIVYIPNAFSPDKGGPEKNKDFHVVASGFKTFELFIFNRWGEVLYKTTDINKGWDGNFMGKPCQQDVYAYIAKLTNFSDEEFIYNGTITLLR